LKHFTLLSGMGQGAPSSAAAGVAAAVKAATPAELDAAFAGLEESEVQKIINALGARRPRSLAEVPVAPPDGILTLAQWFKEDSHPQKVNLGIGAYRTSEGKPWPLPSVLAAQLAVCEDPSEDKEYVPIDGKPEHKRPVQQLMFSDAEIDKGTIVSAQTLSGTGALTIISQTLVNLCGIKTIWVSNPTWGNHHAIFKRAGLEVKEYPYYQKETGGLAFDEMMQCLEQLPEQQAILFHACAHNPTGVDPSEEQWKKILDVIIKRKVTPLLDNAYQGYASGDLEKDGKVVKLFEEYDRSLEFFAAQSFAKNFGLYGERIGYLHFRASAKEHADTAISQIKLLIRQAYSSPPRHGAAIVNKVLTSSDLKAQWLSELKLMSDRITQMREELRKTIEANKTPSPMKAGTWEHITSQIGMFTYTGLTQPQVERLVNEFHIYMTKDGRISVAGLNSGNIPYVAECIDKVMKG